MTYFPSLTLNEKSGLWLHNVSLPCFYPIDRTVEIAMRAFSTAILPGQFGNQRTFWTEVAVRALSVTAATAFLPFSLALYGIGECLEKLGDQWLKRPYDYLEGSLTPQETKESYTVFSGNLCMLPYGISALGGVRPSFARIDELAKTLLEANADFLCLQEVALSPSLALWDKIKESYVHGLTRVGPTPINRMASSLFFASKYPIKQVLYHPLTYEGPIVKGALCIRVEAGWIVNTHLSSGEENDPLRQKQTKEILSLCRNLSEKDNSPCFLFMDSNIPKTGRENDEYSTSELFKVLINGVQYDDPFVLNEDTATYTSCLSASIQGREDPLNIEEAFEHVDYALALQGKITSSLLPGYDLSKRDEALSDHHFLFSIIRSKSI